MTVTRLSSKQAKKKTSLRDRVSEAEWKTRTDLAAAYQLAVVYGWTDMILTHFSARVPDAENQFLLNAYGLMFDEVTASNLVKIDHKGNILEDVTGFGVNQAGFVIHGCVHEARPEANCVLHTHTRAGIAVAASTEGLLPLSQHSARLVGEVTYHEYEGIALDMDERERLAHNLGPASRCMVLRNHGLLTLGRTVREAFNLMYNLEQSCRIQLDALAAVGRAGGHAHSGRVVERTRQQVNRPRGRTGIPRLAGAPADARPARRGLP
jgi:ribulose-5-phosphate 4-epimerase/fuculose-1-phosphate aldolase